jgi:hypothetical protein
MKPIPCIAGFVPVILAGALNAAHVAPVATITNRTFSKVSVGWGNFELPTVASYHVVTGIYDNGEADLVDVDCESKVTRGTVNCGSITDGFLMDENVTATWTFDMTNPPPTTSTSGEYKSRAFVIATQLISGPNDPTDEDESEKFVTVP